MSGKNMAASVRQRLLNLALVKLGLTNSRMKDFYDLALMARTFPFTGSVLRDAVRATFTRRQTALPAGTPTALTEAFATDETKRRQWSAFCARSGLGGKVGELGEVIAELVVFLGPVLAAARGDAFAENWEPGGPWKLPT